MTCMADGLDYFAKLLRVVKNVTWRQHITIEALYAGLRFSGHCWKSKNEVVSVLPSWFSCPGWSCQRSCVCFPHSSLVQANPLLEIVSVALIALLSRLIFFQRLACWCCPHGSLHPVPSTCEPAREWPAAHSPSCSWGPAKRLTSWSQPSLILGTSQRVTWCTQPILFLGISQATDLLHTAHPVPGNQPESDLMQTAHPVPKTWAPAKQLTCCTQPSLFLGTSQAIDLLHTAHPVPGNQPETDLLHTAHPVPGDQPETDLLHTALICCTQPWPAAHSPDLLHTAHPVPGDQPETDLLHTALTCCTQPWPAAHSPDLLHTALTCCT